MTGSKNDDKSNLVLALIKEADVDNHLGNGNKKEANAKKPEANNAQAADTAPNQPLAVSDYQLHEALSLLKALNIVSATN